jgi:hypothetical protein
MKVLLTQGLVMCIDTNLVVRGNSVPIHIRFGSVFSLGNCLSIGVVSQRMVMWYSFYRVFRIYKAMCSSLHGFPVLQVYQSTLLYLS